MNAAVKDLAKDIADIALARVLSKTPFVGFIGGTIFFASSIITNTFNEINRKAESRFVEHDVIYGKPLTEFTGNDLKDFTVDITLHSALGVDPLLFYEGLEKMVESGQPQMVFINYKKTGIYTARKVEGIEKYWALGRPAVMDVTLTLREYVSSLPTEAERKLREAELRREDTGAGGPDKLPGTPADVAALSPTGGVTPA